MPTEAGSRIGDVVAAEMIECTVEDTSTAVSLLASAAPEGASPTRQAAEATEAQTGSDPPPEGRSTPPALPPDLIPAMLPFTIRRAPTRSLGVARTEP